MSEQTTQPVEQEQPAEPPKRINIASGEDVFFSEENNEEEAYA